MDDLIRRSDVFELLDNWDSEMIVRDSFYCDVEDIPTAQQCEIAAYEKDCDTCHFCDKQKWVPCSERLPGNPDGDRDYFYDGADIRADEYVVMIRGALRPTSAYWSEDGEWIDVYNPQFGTLDVIAWQPLPKPYTEEQT